MLYLICRADQVPHKFSINRPVEFKPSVAHYPRIVWADFPEEAIERAFLPEQYKPGGARDLVVIELGDVFQFTATPIPPPPPPPNFTLSRTRGSRELLRPF